MTAHVTQVEVYNGAVPVGFATLVAPDTYRFDYQASSPGLVKFQVRASDDLGNVGFSDLVEVSVITGAIPTVTILSPDSGDSLKAGETLEITVNAFDLGGFITSVGIFNNDVLLGLANPTGVAGAYLLSYRTSAADLGNLNLQARAIDNQGNVGFSAVVDFSVVQGAVPTVSIDSPANGDVFFINTPITLALSAADGDDSIVSVEVFSNGTSVGFASATGVDDDYEFVLTATAAAGLQRLTAVATDELSNSTTSSEVNVLLTSGAAPIVNINEVNGVAVVDPWETLVVTRGSLVTLDITASDSDGTVNPQQVEVFNGAVSVGFANLIGADTYRLYFPASSPGLVRFQVRATDDLGNIGFSDLVPVSVVTGAIPTVEILSPESGTSATAGKNVEILVQVADDDGQITKVEIFGNRDPLGNLVSLGFATPTGNVNEYRLNLPTSVADVGSFILQARATDERGNVGFSELVTLNVVFGAVPQIEILSPLPGESFFINQPFVIRARITDADGTFTGATFVDADFRTETQLTAQGNIVQVIVEASRSFNGDDVLAPTSTEDEYQFVATLDTADLIGLVITATDDDGNVTTSSKVQFTVTNGIAPDVAITAPLTGASYTLGEVVTIDIDASDQDGTIETVKLYNGTEPFDGEAYFVSAGTYRYTYVADAVGKVNLRAQATDNLGNEGISNIETITIVSGDVPTVAIDSPVRWNFLHRR